MYSIKYKRILIIFPFLHKLFKKNLNEISLLLLALYLVKLFLFVLLSGVLSVNIFVSYKLLSWVINCLSIVFTAVSP